MVDSGDTFDFSILMRRRQRFYIVPSSGSHGQDQAREEVALTTFYWGKLSAHVRWITKHPARPGLKYCVV